jgi:hypothetical protein
VNEFNYSAALRRCMLISAAALIAGVFLPIPHFIPFAAALAPLVWYHVLFLRPRAADGLSQAAIDSVYYYGFLITVGALGATALDLSLHGIGEDFAPVAFQFGLGLLATGYAVWARVDLVSIAKQLDEEELQNLMAQQIERSRELVTSVEMASSSFQAFAETLISKSAQFATTVEAQTQASIDDAMKAFRNGISAMTEEAQLALRELRGIVNDVTFGAEREQLKSSVTAMVETVNTLSEGLSQLAASSNAGAGSANEFASSLATINQNAASASGELEKLGMKDGIVAKFSDALTVGQASAAELASVGMDAATSIKAMGDNSAMARDTLQVLAKALDKAKAAASSAEDVKAGLDGLGSHSGEAALQDNDLQKKVEELNATLLNLNGALIDSTGGLKDSMVTASEALEALAQRSLASQDLAGTDFSDQAIAAE